MKKIIGITGGIGSGKSLVSMVLRRIGFNVYDADSEAKALMNSNKKLKEELISTFGNDIYDFEGNLNRKKMGEIVFSTLENTQKANKIIHPAVQEHFKIWAENQIVNENMPFVFKEAALMFESNSYTQLNAIVTVYAPKELRILRAMKRDNATKEAIELRIAKQIPEIVKLTKSNFVIFNDGEHLILPQIQKMLKRLNEI